MTPEEVALFIRLVGAREFALAAQTAGASVKALGIEAETTGRAFDRTTRRGYLMNQALFTIRRLMYGTTLAVVAAGGAALDMGFKFNSAMQQATVALRPVFKSTQALRDELNYLFNFTKYTPFQFKDVTIAFRQLYAAFQPLGISVGTVNKTLASMTDALSFAGRTTPSALNRVSVALQHMAYQGHLTGYAVNQLARDGIPIFAVLRKELGLTGEQIHNIGKLGIPTKDVLKAINDYIESTPGFAHAAYRQATGSLVGLFTTFKDNLSQLMGAVESGFFHRIQGRLVDMNKWFDRLDARVRMGGKTGGATAIILAIDPSLLRIWTLLGSDIHWVWVNFNNLIHAFLTNKVLWGTLYIGLQLLHGVLLLISPITAAFGGYLNILIPLFVAWYGATRLAAFWTGILAVVEGTASVATKDLTFTQFALRAAMYAYYGAVRLAAVATGVWTVLTMGYVRGSRGQFIAMSNTEKMALRLRTAFLGVAASTSAFAGATWASTAALLANPVTWIVLGVLALTAGLVVLYFKWKAFHNAVNDTAHFLWTNAPAMAAALSLAFGPLGVALSTILLIVRYWQQIKQAFIGKPNTPSVHTQLFGSQRLTPSDNAALRKQGINPKESFLTSSLNALKGAFGFASGGVMPYSGWGVVGERGPELMRLPGGTTIKPPAAFGTTGRENWRETAGYERPFEINVMIDKRVLGRVTAEEVAKARARS